MRPTRQEVTPRKLDLLALLRIVDIFVSRNPAFLLVASDEALWRELKSERFTTPLLREWMPHVRAELVRRHLLVECRTYPHKPIDGGPGVVGVDLPLSCVCLCAASKDIDTIVVEGLKAGAIEIPGGEVSEPV